MLLYYHPGTVFIKCYNRRVFALFHKYGRDKVGCTANFVISRTQPRYSTGKYNLNVAPLPFSPCAMIKPE